MHRQAKHAMQGNQVLVPLSVSHQNCSTQWFLKVMTASRNVSAAVAHSLLNMVPIPPLGRCVDQCTKGGPSTHQLTAQSRFTDSGNISDQFHGMYAPALHGSSPPSLIMSSSCTKLYIFHQGLENDSHPSAGTDTPY